MVSLYVALSEYLLFLSSAKGVMRVAAGLIWPSINLLPSKQEVTSSKKKD